MIKKKNYVIRTIAVDFISFYIVNNPIISSYREVFENFQPL